jgi:hypothetical protein
MSQGEYVMVRTAGLEGMGDRLERIAVALERLVQYSEDARAKFEELMDEYQPHMQSMGALAAMFSTPKVDDKGGEPDDSEDTPAPKSKAAQERRTPVAFGLGASTAVPSAAAPSTATPSAAVPVPSARVSGTRAPSNTPEGRPEGRPDAKPADAKTQVTKGRRVIRARKAPVFRQLSESVSVAPSEEEDEGFVVRLAQ